MNALVSSIKVVCRRKVVLSTISEHPFPLNVLIGQHRFKGKSQHLRTPNDPKEKEQFTFRAKKKPEVVVIDYEVSPTPCTDDVWIRKYYPEPTYPFLEAVRRHRDYASPEMTSNMDGVLMLEANLDLRTKKKTKFMQIPSGIILLPHDFDNFFPGRVIAITKDADEQARATEAGAIYAGGVDLIRKIEKGDIVGEDFDRVVLNPNLLVEAAIIKKVLKDLFPSKKNGTLCEDVEGTVRMFVHGKEYQGSKVSESVGKLTFPIGKLSMTDEQLVDNLKAIIESVVEQNKGGPGYFSKLSVICPPSKEVFVVQEEGIMSQEVIDARKILKQKEAAL